MPKLFAFMFLLIVAVQAPNPFQALNPFRQQSLNPLDDNPLNILSNLVTPIRDNEINDPTEIEVHIDAASCSKRIKTQKPPHMATITTRETCNLCERVVQNAFAWPSWKYRDDLSMLCNDVPAHLLEWCEWYVCKMYWCKEFRQQECSFQFSNQAKSFTPCTSRFICWQCLQIPSQDAAGCFSGMVVGL